MQYYSTKIIHLGSCAFRQPKAVSHCNKLHGYRLSAKITFSCKELDENNWVVDFGGLKNLKQLLEYQFDHTTCIALNDPELDTFKMLEQKGIIDLRIMDGVGIEKFAEFVFHTANTLIKTESKGRCWVQQVEVWEHEQNSAGVVNITTNDIDQVNKMLTNDSQIQPTAETENLHKKTKKSKGSTSVPQEAPKPMVESRESTMPTQVPSPDPSSVANPLYAKPTPGFSNLFAGTSWGNK